MAKQIVPCASRLESAFFTRDLSSLDWRIRGDLEKARRSMAHADSEDLSRSAVLASDRRIDDDRGGFRIRIYTPETMPRPAPGLLFFHGGGFYGGGLDYVDHPCRYLADRMGGAVVSVDYALAPEAPYPRALNEGEAALDWTMENAATLGVDPGRIGLAGDSAGGNLAFALALREADRGRRRIRFLGLLYPVLDLTGRGPERSRYAPERFPVEDGPEKPVIEALYRQIADLSGEIRDLYLSGGAGEARYHSPLGETAFPVLPPTLLAAAEYDALRPQAECMHDLLEERGTPVEYLLYRGVGHGFMDKLGRCPQAADCLDRIAGHMREA